MNDQTIAALKRFVKGLIAAFVAQAILVVPTNYDSLNSYLTALLVSGIAGLLLAVQKYYSWKE